MASAKAASAGTSNTAIPVRMPARAAMQPITGGVTTEPKLLTVTNTPIASGYRPNTSPALAIVVPYMPERASPRPTVPSSIGARLALASSTAKNNTMPPHSARII